MIFLSILIIAIGLAMDSVTVSVSCGLILMNYSHKNTLRIALYMGVFQGVMPLIGWFLGSAFKQYIEAYDHWIALIILAALGGKMIYEYLTSKDEFKCFDPTSHKVLIGLAIATSIDALAVGITFGIMEISLFWTCTIIGIVSFLLSFLAVYLGKEFRTRMQKIPFELIGGIILLLIGIKIFIEHSMHHGLLSN